MVRIRRLLVKAVGVGNRSTNLNLAVAGTCFAPKHAEGLYFRGYHVKLILRRKREQIFVARSWRLIPFQLPDPESPRPYEALVLPRLPRAPLAPEKIVIYLRSTDRPKNHTLIRNFETLNLNFKFWNVQKYFNTTQQHNNNNTGKPTRH